MNDTRIAFPLWLTLLACLCSVGLVLFLVVTLREESPRSASTVDDAWTSSLLPDGWSTYRADVWSMGYPSDWEVDRQHEGTGGPATTWSVHVHPSDTDSDRLVVVREDRSLAEIEAEHATQEVTRDMFLFAGYPAVKFSTPERNEYYVSYNDQLFLLATDTPADTTVDIMLATFQFVD